MKTARRNRTILYTVAALIFIVVSYLTFALPSEDYRLIVDRKINLNHGWTVEYGDTVINDVKLPHDLNLEADAKYTARLILPDDLENHIRLRIRSSMQDVIVYVDGNEIYRDIKGKDGKLQVPDASLWHLFELPNDIGGKELSIQMQSPTKAFSGMLNEVYAGEGKDLIFEIISSNLFKLTLSVVFFIFGLTTIILSGIFRNFEDNRLIYLGSFAMFVAIWIFSESKVMQMFVRNRFILGGLSYMIIPLIAITFYCFSRSRCCESTNS